MSYPLSQFITRSVMATFLYRNYQINLTESWAVGGASVHSTPDCCIYQAVFQ